MKFILKKIKWGAIITFLLTIISLFYTIYFQPSKTDYKKLQKFLVGYKNNKIINEVELLPSGIPINLKDKIDEFEKLIESVETSPFVRLNADSCFQISNFYSDLGDYKKAYIFINKALNKKKDEPKYLANRIKINFYRDNFTDLEKDFIQIENNLIDADKIELLSSISSAKYITGDIEGCLHYSEKTFDLLNKIKKIEDKEYYYFSSKYNLFMCNFLKGDLKQADNHFVNFDEYMKKLKSSKDLNQILYQKIFLAIYSSTFGDKKEFENQTDEWLKLYKNSKKYNPVFEDYIKFFSLYFKPITLSEIKKFNVLCVSLRNKENIFFQKQLTYMFLMRILNKNDVIKISEIQNYIEHADLRKMERIDVYFKAGGYFFDKKEYEKSIFFLNKVFANLKNTPMNYMYMQTLLRLGQVEFSINNFFNAKKLIIKSKNLFQMTIIQNINNKFINEDIKNCIKNYILIIDQLSEQIKLIERVEAIFSDQT